MNTFQELEMKIKNGSLGPLFLMANHTNDPAHDGFHLIRVAHWTLRLAPSEPELNCIAAALLHDLVNLPKNHLQRANASALSANKAREILPDFGFGPNDTNQICDAITQHSFSAGHTPTSLLAKALQDADRLEALGAIGLMRTFSVGAKLGLHFFDSQDPWAKNRSLDDKKFTVDHFFVKLLKLPETFQTVEGQIEARNRTKILIQFLGQLGQELGEVNNEITNC